MPSTYTKPSQIKPLLLHTYTLRRIPTMPASNVLCLERLARAIYTKFIPKPDLDPICYIQSYLNPAIKAHARELNTNSELIPSWESMYASLLNDNYYGGILYQAFSPSFRCCHKYAKDQLKMVSTLWFVYNVMMHRMQNLDLNEELFIDKVLCEALCPHPEALVPIVLALNEELGRLFREKADGPAIAALNMLKEAVKAPGIENPPPNCVYSSCFLETKEGRQSNGDLQIRIYLKPFAQLTIPSRYAKSSRLLISEKVKVNHDPDSPERYIITKLDETVGELSAIVNVPVGEPFYISPLTPRSHTPTDDWSLFLETPDALFSVDKNAQVEMNRSTVIVQMNHG
jgi:hypothetical protein